MKKFLFFIFLSPIVVCAQVNLKITLTQNTRKHNRDTFYIAGSFNNWNPKDDNYKFIDNNGIASLNLKVPTGVYEYKITRGSWNSVETTSDGKATENRKINVRKDTIINLTVLEWSDDFKNEPVVKKHTASSHVSILDSAFNIPQLNTTRRIWLYLPKDYSTSKKRFPVLYMHDGQNLFDEATSGFGEWGIDECLDSLFNQGKKECIIIGIDNGPKRMNEYNPYDFKPYGKGEGNDYVDFIVKTLKPFIDKRYRTIKDKNATFIGGSSMGGLISLYAVIKYPQVFGGAGIFSPAFWTAAGIEDDVKQAAPKIKSKLYFYAGGKEGERMVPDMKKIESIIKSISSAKIFEEVDPEAKHNEAAWRKYFPEFYNWMMSN